MIIIKICHFRRFSPGGLINMSTIKRFLATVVFVIFISGITCTGALPKGASCIVMPSRYTVIQFAFDMIRLRQSIYLVSYDREPSSGSIVLHIWDDNNKAWQGIGLEQYLAGSIFSEQPKSVVLLGMGKDLPQELTGVSSWCTDMFRVTSLDIVTLVKSFHDAYNFNKREWQWLADKYGITYEDRNEERRRYGRYGKPGEKLEAPAPETQIELRIPEGPIEIISQPVSIDEEIPFIEPDRK